MKRSLLMAALAALLVGMAFVTGCNAHVHEFEEKWMSDAAHHWHKATCEHADEKDGWAAHVFEVWTEGKSSCSVCGYEKICTHSFGEWEVVTPATEEAAGARKRECEVCGFVQNDTIPMKGHTEDGGTVVTPATYVAKGKKSFACTECKTWLRDEDIDMLEPIYVFTEEVKAAPSDYVGTNGASSTYVVFGDFPQSEAAEGITYRTEPEKNGYYVGSDGNYYAKVTVEKTRNGYTVGDVKYFKVEPIKWRVVTDSYDYDGSAGKETAKLLLAENVLTADVPYYYTFKETRSVTKEGVTVSGIWPNNYEYSQIRAFLNGLAYYDNSNKAVGTYQGAGFLQTAFTASARDLIKTTYVDNSAASTTDSTGTVNQATSYACDDTQDKIFLLSEKEATATGYGFGKYNVQDSVRVHPATAYAKAHNAFVNAETGIGGSWWFRSPNSLNGNTVHSSGTDGSAIYDVSVDDSYHGVCPALCISFTLK